jgi:hypothetical protein
MPRGPVVEIPEIKFERKHHIAGSQMGLKMSQYCRNHFSSSGQSFKFLGTSFPFEIRRK